MLTAALEFGGPCLLLEAPRRLSLTKLVGGWGAWGPCLPSHMNAEDQ